VFAVTRLRVPPADVPDFTVAAGRLLAALRDLPGFLGGDLGRAADEPGLFALCTRWDGVGSYRRGLSAAAVKIAGAPVWVHALDEPGVYLTD
jgi:heme-degrading monooxygenase HmoA